MNILEPGVDVNAVAPRGKAHWKTSYGMNYKYAPKRVVYRPRIKSRTEKARIKSRSSSSASNHRGSSSHNSRSSNSSRSSNRFRSPSKKKNNLADASYGKRHIMRSNGTIVRDEDYDEGALRHWSHKPALSPRARSSVPQPRSPKPKPSRDSVASLISHPNIGMSKEPQFTSSKSNNLVFNDGPDTQSQTITKPAIQIQRTALTNYAEVSAEEVLNPYKYHRKKIKPHLKDNRFKKQGLETDKNGKLLCTYRVGDLLKDEYTSNGPERYMQFGPHIGPGQYPYVKENKRPLRARPKSAAFAEHMRRQQRVKKDPERPRTPDIVKPEYLKPYYNKDYGLPEDIERLELEAQMIQTKHLSDRTFV